MAPRCRSLARVQKKSSMGRFLLGPPTLDASLSKPSEIVMRALGGIT